jgi:stress-induced-phosphoprotein 1
MAALEHKQQGNKYYSQGDYINAIECYTKAIEANNKDHTFFSNRAAAHFALGNYEISIDDARQCIAIAPNWVKGYYRAALSMKELLLFEEASEILQKGLKVESGNRDLKTLQVEVNKELNTMKAKSRKGADGKPLSPAASAKEEGNEQFKAGMHDVAIRWYTRAIVLSKEADRDIKIASLSNRANCYAQHHNYKKVIEDTTRVLEMDPRHVKALIRRGLAYEATEKYKLGLEDMREAQAVSGGSAVISQAISRLTHNVRYL